QHIHPEIRTDSSRRYGFMKTVARYPGIDACPIFRMFDRDLHQLYLLDRRYRGGLSGRSQNENTIDAPGDQVIDDAACAVRIDLSLRRKGGRHRHDDALTFFMLRHATMHSCK